MSLYLVILNNKPLGALDGRVTWFLPSLFLALIATVAASSACSMNHQEPEFARRMSGTIPAGSCRPEDLEGTLLFQLSPGMVIGGPGRSFALQVTATGDAQLSTTGMSLPDGNYTGRADSQKLAELRAALGPALGPFKSLCDGGHVSSFSMTRLTSTCYRSACLTTIEISELAGAYRLVLEIMSDTEWNRRA